MYDYATVYITDVHIFPIKMVRRVELRLSFFGCVQRRMQLKVLGDRHSEQ